MTTPLYLGIDIGGTKTLAIIADADGSIVGRALNPTPGDQQPIAIVAAMANTAHQALADANVDAASVVAAGIASAGAIDTAHGIVVWAPQTPSLVNTPMADMFRAHWDLPIAMGNDANLAALAEQRFGAAKGSPNVLFITISTGIGGGIVLDGKLYTGTSGFAAEIGHITVDAHGPYGPSKTPGAWEALCSGRALARISTERIAAGESSSLASLPSIDAIAVFDAMRAGDALAASVIDDAILYLGAGLTSVMNVLDPGVIVIGGGLSNEWDAYIAPGIALMRTQAFANMAQHTRMVPPALGVDAGAMGAIALATTLA
jgi:glucokinase